MKIKVFLFSVLFSLAALSATTYFSLSALPDSLSPNVSALKRSEFVDRNGHPLRITYENALNLSRQISLKEVPASLKKLFIESEDRRFYDHKGVDWRARLAAVLQNVLARKQVRGASTISEQVVRILNPRKRTLWSRWLEGFEAMRLEKKFQKDEILEFYLNQVPYGRKRRGVVEAARDVFGRDLETLSLKEQLALVILVRSPSRLDPRGGSFLLEQAIDRFSKTLVGREVFNDDTLEILSKSTLIYQSQSAPIFGQHFISAIDHGFWDQLPKKVSVRTTIDGELQEFTNRTLKTRLANLAERNVTKASCMVVDHKSNEILVWANADMASTSPTADAIDAVLMKRQPGSTLKPFLYALALENGYTAASLIDDSPDQSAVALGIHSYRNYSGKYYGPIRLRNALGNSLNLPAIKVVKKLGAKNFGAERLLDNLKLLGFESLEKSADYYGEGLALGNGEVTLYELVRAYAALARGGVWQDFHPLLSNSSFENNKGRFMSEETAAIITNILSDPSARLLEFGPASMLNFSSETAVKTGTSTDFRDAWALAYNDQFTLGVWMGNANQMPMRELSGARGPVIVLRTVMAELNKRRAETHPLALSTKLVHKNICRLTGKIAGNTCPIAEEIFSPAHLPTKTCDGNHSSAARTTDAFSSDFSSRPRIILPTEGLLLARDPRIPDDLEVFNFQITPIKDLVSIKWILDGELIGESHAPSFPWKVKAGKHQLEALVTDKHGQQKQMNKVNFLVY